MEHVVQSSSRRQLEADSHLVDQLQDLIQPDIARLELPLGRVGKGRRSALPEAQSCPVADLEGHQPMVLVVEELLRRLSLLQAIADVVEESHAVLHLLSHRGHPGLSRLV